MGRKRKRGHAKQNWGSTNSRKQKKKTKTRGQGFKHANVPKEVDSLHIIPSNSTDCKITREKSESSCIEISCALADESLQRWRFWRINAIFYRLKTLASIFQHSTIEYFLSFRGVFLLLNWLKQTFGCGLQTLAKFLLAEKGRPILCDRATHLEEMVKRMEALEGEVKSLKSELDKKTTCPCGDHCNRYSSETQVGCVPQGLPLKILPPPPPPPPPPPIHPPAAPPLAFLKNKQPVCKASTSKDTKNKSSKTLVTLEDLRKVKLKKVKQVDETDKENAQPESKTTGFKCVVTLRDLKNVTLKRTKTENELEKIKLRTPEEMVVTKRNLRKVNITRSPGGTPLVSEKNHEHGTGLTPMMTKALRKKFQHAHPYSSPESPSYQKRRQSLSPMTVSPNSRIPLSFR